MIDAALNNAIVINDPLDEAIQELDILFNTTYTELLGDVGFGTDWYQFLYECTPSPNELRKYIYEKVQDNCHYVLRFKMSVNVDILDDDTENVYVVTIKLTDPSAPQINKQKTFIFN